MLSFVILFTIWSCGPNEQDVQRRAENEKQILKLREDLRKLSVEHEVVLQDLQYELREVKKENANLERDVERLCLSHLEATSIPEDWSCC